MLECEYVRQIGAYYDRELPPQQCLQLEEHIRQCPMCTRELERLRSLSRLLAAATAPEMSAIALKRLHRAVGPLSERMIIRTAEFFAAVAAMVLLGCLVGLPRVPSAGEPKTGLADWERIAVAQKPDTIVMGDATEQFATWLVQDLSQEDVND